MKENGKLGATVFRTCEGKINDYLAEEVWDVALNVPERNERANGSRNGSRNDSKNRECGMDR